MRPPLVVGLSRGVGTSTVAVALHAVDGGLCTGAADIVVCGSDPRSLDLAEAAAVSRIRPQLAIACGHAGVQRSRLRLLVARFGTVVVLPHIARWHALAGPPEEVAALLGQPPDHLPRPLRVYSAALRALTTAVLRSGQLHGSAPPAFNPPPPPACTPPPARRVDRRPLLVAAPRPVRPTLITGPPSRRTTPAVAVGRSSPPAAEPLDLDDEAIEACAHPEPAGRTG